MHSKITHSMFISLWLCAFFTIGSYGGRATGPKSPRSISPVQAGDSFAARRKVFGDTARLGTVTDQKDINGNVNPLEKGITIKVTPKNPAPDFYQIAVPSEQKTSENGEFHLQIPHGYNGAPLIMEIFREGQLGILILELPKTHNKKHWYVINLGANPPNAKVYNGREEVKDVKKGTKIDLVKKDDKQQKRQEKLLHEDDANIISSFKETSSWFGKTLTEKASVNSNNEKVFEGLKNIQEVQTTAYEQMYNKFVQTNNLIRDMEGVVQTQGNSLEQKAEEIKTEATGHHGDLKKDLQTQLDQITMLKSKSESMGKDVSQVLKETTAHSKELPKIEEAQNKLKSEVINQKNELKAVLGHQLTEIQSGNKVSEEIRTKVVAIKNGVEKALPEKLAQQTKLIETQISELKNVETNVVGFQQKYVENSKVLDGEIKKTHSGIAELKATQLADAQKLEKDLELQMAGIQGNKALLVSEASALGKQFEVVVGIDNKANKLTEKSALIGKEVESVIVKVGELQTVAVKKKVELYEELKKEIEENRVKVHVALKKDIGEKVDERAAKLHKELDEDIGKKITATAKSLHADLKAEIEKKIEDSEKNLHALLKKDIEKKIDDSTTHLQTELKKDIESANKAIQHEITGLKTATLSLKTEIKTQIEHMKTEIETKIAQDNQKILTEMEDIFKFMKHMKMQVIE